MRDERQYVVESIRGFLDGSGAPWDWDRFTSSPLRSTNLNAIRRIAGKVDLPLDAEGEATLRVLLEEAEQLSPEGATKPKSWRMEAGMAAGLLVGAPLWWVAYIEGGGLFQNLHLLLIPAALGILGVSLRNRRLQLGYYDPDVIEQNKRGRV